MKKGKEWLKEKLNTEKYHRGTNELKTKTTYGELYDRGVSDGINVALEFVDQLDEPKKVVIPQFVADYIERAKPRHDSLYQAMEERAGEEVNEWVQAFYNSNKFARAWLDGYEVEKEKKYLVKLPHESDMGLSLYLSRQFGVEWVDEETMADHITEAEIKAIDKRYWAFAEEVTQ